MEDDQQVAVLLQLNLNGTGNNTESLDPVWKDLSPTSHNISINESSGSDEQDHETNTEGKKFADHNLIEKDFEFIRKHASDADIEFLHSLFESQIDNPKRLETIMYEMLNIPNAMELIQDFRRNTLKAGDKRSINDCQLDKKENDSIKKKKIIDTENYLQQIRDMFPDADGLFLISECQQLESWEDYTRFVNTVMISGIYPKKGAVEYSPKSEPSRIIDIVNNSDYRTVETISSEDEISSSGVIDIPKRHQRQKRKNQENKNSECRNLLSTSEIEVVDITSDNTEPYDVSDAKSIEEMFYSCTTDEEQPEKIQYSIEPQPWETSLVDDIDNLLKNKFGQENKHRDFDQPSAGPSNKETSVLRARLSLPGRILPMSPEKSLAEIIEERRHNRRLSLGERLQAFNHFDMPSTSTNSPDVKQVFFESISEKNSEVSSPEVSTTSDAPKGKTESETDAMSVEEEDSYKVGEEWLNEQIANLIRIFPNTDPSYLREELILMNGSLEAVNEFVVSKLEVNDMPTRAEYEKKKEMEELQNRYTNNFSIQDFLKVVPDPWKYFTQGNRNCTKYKNHSLCYLKSVFRNHYVRDILDTFNKNNCNLYLSYQILKKACSRKRGSRRSEFECNSNRPTTIDIQFLQEVAFIENEEKIKDYLETEKIAREIKFEEAKRTGSLLECQCCFDSEVMVEDIFYCPKDHPFCKECITKSVEVEMGNGRSQFECLTNCEEKFTLACLQSVLKPELFSKVLQATQMEEIRAAEIEDLVQCPFCNYATIMPPEEKVLACLNPECLKESCRLCKELNHIPLRCDEVEKSEEVKMRTYIENKMTEALVRTCYKCGKKFVKEDGCNKMTCTCGAKMCYVCRKPVTGYSHFNGLGGTEYEKCPLYALNDELHVDLVRRVAEEAKAEIMQANPQTKLMHDPTIVMPERTYEKPMPGMNNGIALNVGLRALIGNRPGKTEVHTHRHHRHSTDNHHRRRHEANPYYGRYHHHRVITQLESDEDEGEEEGNVHNGHHHHYRSHARLHHRHRQTIHEDKHRHYHQ